MMTSTLIQALVGLGSFAILLVLLYGPWQEICTDIARQIVFEKRDAIFDLAHSGKLSFDSQEYRTIRASLQSSIRFAHELTLPRFLVITILLWSRGSHPEDSDLRRAIRRIADPATRIEVERLIGQAYRALFGMMVAKSPLMFVALLVLWVPGLITLRYFRSVVDAAKVVERRAGGFIQLEADAA